MYKSNKRVLSNPWYDESVDCVKFGKFSGQSLSKLLRDQPYCSWLKTQSAQSESKPSFVSFVKKFVKTQQTKDTKTIQNSKVSKKAITLDNLTFTNKNDASQHVRILLKKIGFCSSLKGTAPMDYDRVLSILKLHPDVAKQQLLQQAVDLEIYQINSNQNVHHINVLLEDGSKESISWTSCVTQKCSSHTELLNSSMRRSIQDQIDDFRDQNQHNKRCGNCDTTSGEFHVDHVKFFVELQNSFLQSTTCLAPTIFDKDQCFTVFCKEDQKFQEEWQEYHRVNAKLQWLCKSCNLRRKPEVTKK